MEQIPCTFCGDFFDQSPRHKSQTACKKEQCRKQRRAAWQRFKMQNDPVYRANQKSSQKKWLEANPDYWKKYRRKNIEKAERNRVLQRLRNSKARTPPSSAKMDAVLIAKMDSLKSANFQILGQFWLIPVIAKMDSLKVNIIKIPTVYP